MANINRDYLVIADLKSGKITSPNMSFYNTDKNIANLFVKLQITMSTNPSIVGFVNKEEASNYNVKLTVVKPKTTMLVELTGVVQDESVMGNGAVYLFDMPQNFTDQVGKYICELEITCMVNGREEIVTCDPFRYTVKASAVTGLNVEIEPNPDIPVLRQLIDEVRYLQENEVSAETFAAYQKITDDKLKQVEIDLNEAVANATNGSESVTNSEIVLARKGKTSLREKIDEFDSQIKEIENKEKNVDIKQTKTLITFGSDDGWLEDYTIVKPILDKYNYPMSVALVPGYLSDTFPQYISEAQAKEMVASGWEVVNHSVNNEMLGEVTFSKAKYYIDQCHRELTQKGFDVKGIVYPQGSFNDDVLNYVKSIYNYGVSIIPNYENNPVNTYFLNRWHFDDANITFEYYKNIIDNCEGKWTIFMLHGSYFRTNPELIPILEQLVDYVNSKGYEVVNYSQGLEYYKNTVFAGNEKRCTKIGSDGSFYSDDLLENFTDDKYITQDTPITYFPKDKITTKVFTTLDSVTFPDGAVGTLETYRFSKHEDLSFQLWHSAYQYKIYKRIWSTSLKKWLDFKDITLEYKIPVTTTDVKAIEGNIQIRNKGVDKQNEITICLKNSYNTLVHTKLITQSDTSLNIRSSLLPPSEEHRGKQVLIQADGVEDKLYICVRRLDGNYHWKQVQFI